MAAVWSLDGSRAVRVSRGIKAGQVHINSFAALHDGPQLRTTTIKHG